MHGKGRVPVRIRSLHVFLRSCLRGAGDRDGVAEGANNLCSADVSIYPLTGAWSRQFQLLLLLGLSFINCFHRY